MNKWESIEEMINNLLMNVMEVIKGKSRSLTPKKIKKKYQSSKELLTNRRGELKHKIKKGKELAIEKAVKAKDSVDKVKVKAADTVIKVRQTDVKNLKLSKIMAALGAFLLPPMLKVKSWYLNLKPTQIAGFVTLSTVATLASVNIYVQSSKIAEEASRSPAAELVEEVERGTEISRRPAYFKRKEKQFQVTNIVLPAYTSSGGAVKKLVIDFTFESSNKYIKNYLWDHPYLVQDVLNSQIEPISLTFPLEDEGKIIVKEKIKKEINSLLKKLKIKGEIKKVYIHSMIAG